MGVDHQIKYPWGEGAAVGVAHQIKYPWGRVRPSVLPIK